MDINVEDLYTRNILFAVAVLEFVDALPRTPAGETVARQLARAGTGVVGNYRSACRDESDESELWVDVANERQWGDSSLRCWLLKESGELRAIFAQAYQTAKSNERRPR
jgi:hypothetical protein